MINFSKFDQLLITLDEGLRTVFGGKPAPTRPSPAASIAEADLSEADKKLSAGLMRVDHVGEVCAQALYQGHALTARSMTIKQQMQQSAEEKNDHLAWCAQRIEQLQSHTSYLNPFWYSGAFTMGVIAGCLGDRWNLGFVAETERQVVAHLTDHLQRVPIHDEKTKTILLQMREDEAHHATEAIAAGAAELPYVVKFAMRMMSKVMTTVAFRI